MSWIERILSSAHGNLRRRSIDADDGHRIAGQASRNRLSIGVLHRQNLTDVLALSGTPSFMLKSLQEHAGDVINLSGHPGLVAQGIELAGLAINKVTYALFRRRISADHHRLLAWRLGSIFTRRVRRVDCDIIFAPTASVELAFLNSDVPIVYQSDINWHDIVDYYPGCTSLFPFVEHEGDFVERAAICRATSLVYPSEWALRSAVEYYGADKERVFYVPYGANFEASDVPARELALEHSFNGRISLLWVGVNWQRKGGDIAYACLMALLENGQDAELTVCGCVPPESFQHDRVRVVPFLNKRIPEQRRRLTELYLKAHFLVFPTMAEAMGIVIGEASAHGLPALVRNTGGVGGMLYEGKNGFLLPPDATGTAYAKKVMETLSDMATYRGLCASSRDFYEQRLNWDIWGESMREVFNYSLAHPMHLLSRNERNKPFPGKRSSCRR